MKRLLAHLARVTGLAILLFGLVWPILGAFSAPDLIRMFAGTIAVMLALVVERLAFDSNI